MNYLVTAKTVSKGKVVNLQGASLGFKEVQAVLRRLQETYSAKDCGWKLETWIENRQGSRLVDFEMLAIRDEDAFPEYQGMGEMFQVSLVEQDRPVRRFR